MEKETLNFVIVGHVDHGKSTLIGRLLYDTGSLPASKVEEMERISREMGREVEFAFVMDHLQEERDQGITIDTAQTFFHTARRDYVIIDAPGHKEFIKNMITGASQAQAALLIIDAEEGVREQTRRHAYLLGLLGLEQVAVLINKMDRVGFARESFEEVAREAGEFLTAIGITPTEVVPISASEGDNVVSRSERLGWYEGPLAVEVLDGFRVLARPAEAPLRMPIQDVYKVGDKRILAGRVESGVLRRGQRIVFLPVGSETTVRSIEKYLSPTVEEVEAGESVGITLEDPLFIERGQVACEPASPLRVTDTVSANVFWMNPGPMASGEGLVLKLATQEVAAAVTGIARRIDSSSLEVIAEDAEELLNNDIAEVTIRTKTPVATGTFYEVPELGRFVLMRGHDIVAGGIITR